MKEDVVVIGYIWSPLSS